jgi:cytoskeletal protein CcmA (bactofilin family)
MSIYIQASNNGPNLSNYPTISQLNNDLLAYESQSQLLAGVTTNALNVNGGTSLSGTLNINGTSSFNAITTTSSTVNGPLNVSGNTTLNTVTVNGATTSTGVFNIGLLESNSLDITGTSSLNGTTTCSTLNSTTHTNSGTMNSSTLNVTNVLNASCPINVNGTIAFSGSPSRTLDLTATNASSIYLDTYGNVKAPSTAPEGTNWHVSDKANNNIFSVYLDGTRAVSTFGNTLDDGNGNLSIIGNLNLPTRGAVTQSTSLSTAISTPYQLGSISLFGSSISGGGTATFQVIDTKVTSTSLIFLQGVGFAQLCLAITSQTTGAFDIQVQNVSGSTVTFTTGQALINYLIL